MEDSYVKPLRVLERENTEFNRIMGNQALDIRLLVDVNAINVVGRSDERRSVNYSG